MASDNSSASSQLSLIELQVNPVAGVSPSIMDYDLPAKPSRPPVQCWTTVEPSNLVALSDGSRRVSSDLSLDCSISLQSVTSSSLSHTTVPPSQQAASEDSCSVTTSCSLNECINDTRCALLFEAFIKRHRQRQQQMESCQASMHLAVGQRMAAMEEDLARELELRERVRIKERRSNVRQEGVPGWVHRARLAIGGLKKRRPNERAPSCDTEEEEVVLERRKADAMVRADKALQSQVAEGLGDIQSLSLTYTEHLKYIMMEDNVDLDNCFKEIRAILSPSSGLEEEEGSVASEDPGFDQLGRVTRILCRSQARGPVIDMEDTRRTNKILKSEEEEGSVASEDPGFDQLGRVTRILCRSEARGPVIDMEEKRRTNKILKSKKHKKIGLMRRFLSRLCCLS